MVECLNRNIFFKLVLVLAIVLSIKFYFDKKKIEEELLKEKLSQKSSGDGGDSNKNNKDILYYEIKKNLGELSEILGQSRDNLKQYSNLAKELGKYNSDIVKLIKNSSKDGKKISKYIDNTLLLSSNDEPIAIFDLSKALEPVELYSPIKCKTSREIFVIATLCVHDIERDIHVSGSIWRDGIWEPHIMQSYMEYIKNNPEWLIMDVGAQIGQYSLLPAKMGRQVLTVEPFYDNVLRIHKAAKTDNTTYHITLITNALSNNRKEIKMLQPQGENIGGQSLVENKNKVIKKEDVLATDPKAKYFVETVLFDDIVPYVPVKTDGSKYKKAILKIDIEAFEPYAFQHASILFDTLDIRIIFMGNCTFNYY
jgi:FkbM family methyltransferase